MTMLDARESRGANGDTKPTAPMSSLFLRERRLREVRRITLEVARDVSPAIMVVEAALSSLAESLRAAKSKGAEGELGAAVTREGAERLRVAGEACQEAVGPVRYLTAELARYARTAFDRDQESACPTDCARRAKLLTWPLLKGSASIDLPSSPMPTVAMPAGDLVQVLINLLTNAAEAAGGSRKVRVRVFRNPDERRGFLHLVVRDDGGGFSPEIAERMFEPGFSRNGRCGAEGMGLSVARTLMERAGGALRLSCNPDGATALLELPLA